MVKGLLIYSSVIFFAFAILFISIFRTAAVRYTFPASQYVHDFNEKVLGDTSKISYTLAYPGKVLPGSPLWPVKAFRDKTWLFMTTNPEREAELLLLFADKRLAASKLLVDNKNIEDSYSALSKAEKYLELASIQALRNKQSGRDTKEISYTLANAALRHYEVIEAILTKIPDEMKPDIIRMQDLSKKVYKDAKQELTLSGNQYPDNPFNWD